MTKCGLCKKRKAEIPVTDEKTGKQIWICESCDLDLFDIQTYRNKLLKEIEIQIRHHIQEGNVAAVNSLKYLMSL